MAGTESFDRSFRLKAFAMYAFAVVILLNRFLSHALFSQMGTGILETFQSELLYRIFQFTQLPCFIFQNHFFALVLDLLLFVLPVMFLATQKRIFAIAFTVLALTYFLVYNLAAMHHYHGFFAVVIISIPFCSKNETRFNFLWEAARYYWLYIFSSAALWKILRGSVFYADQLSNTLKSQQLDFLLQQPESTRAHFVRYLISHPEISHWVLILNVLVQLSFVVGFFTKKFDAALFALAIIFCAANYFVMNIVSAELLILNLTLLNWEKISKLFNKATAE